jgi:hypothetical protein
MIPIVISVGQDYPLHNKARGVEEVRLDISASFFDIIYYMPKPSAADIKTWSKADLRYGIFNFKDIPFFVAGFPASRWYFDTTLNFHKVKNSDVALPWLENKEARNIIFALVNANTNKVEALRVISIEAGLASEIKDICQRQLEEYRTVEEVDQVIDKGINAYDIQTMFKLGKSFVVRNK